MDDPFRYLIEHSGLYDPNFVRTLGEESPHWYVESWYKRELSLRHDMVYTLLANMESAGIRDFQRLDPQPERSQEEDLSSGKASGGSSSSSQHLIPSTRAKIQEDSSDSEDEELPIHRRERAFRLILLEGLLPSQQNKIS